jgi:hypothetical protein
MAQAEAMSIGPAYRTEAIQQAKTLGELAEAVKKVRLEEAQRALQNTETALAAAKKAQAETGPGAMGWLSSAAWAKSGDHDNGRSQRVLEESTRARKAEWDKQISDLEAAKAKELAIINGSEEKEAAATKRFDGAEPKEKADPYQEERLRLERQGLEYAEKTTLEAQRLAEVHKLDLQREEDLTKIQAQLDKKGSTLTQDEAGRLRGQVEENYANARMQVWDKYALKRKEMETKLQEMLTGEEEGGLAKRYAAIEKNTAEIRKINAELAQAGKTPVASEEQLQAAETAAKARALKEQAKADLEELKKDLAHQSEISGQLSRDEIEQHLKTFAAKGPSQAQAVQDYKISVHWDETSADGAKAGVQQFLKQTEDGFTQWKNLTAATLSSSVNSFAQFYSALETRGGSFHDKTLALWRGISGAVVKELNTMAAQETVHWALEKAIAAWKAMASSKEEADLLALMETKVATTAVDDTDDTTDTIANDTEAASATQLAVAETFAAWAMIPGGVAIAAAQVPEIEATVASAGAVTARERGGIIGLHGPEMFLGGERGPEVIAPPSDFKDWANLNQNLGWNLGAHQARVSHLQAQASSYSAAAQQAAQGAGAGSGPGATQGGGGDVHVHIPGPILDTSQRGLQALGNLIINAATTAARSRGQVLQPGLVFGGV